MKNENEGGSEFSPSEIHLIEQLREQPEIMERAPGILDLTRNAEGPLKTADEVEELLIQELRRLGNTNLCRWATRAETRASDELKSQDPTIRSRKKNAEVVVCLWGVRERIWGTQTLSYVRPLPQRLGVTPRA